MMSKISKSPDRHTFQAENYIKRCEEKGEDPREDYLDLYKSARQQDDENMVNLDWQKDNLEYDLRSTEWVLEKVRGDRIYAQNLYAAMCNQDFQKFEVMPVLKDQRWTCSWRHAGGIIADMRQEGDYIDWYCSGIRGDKLSTEEFQKLSVEEQARILEYEAYVPESVVTDEIRGDLKTLGWIVLDEKIEE